MRLSSKFFIALIACQVLVVGAVALISRLYGSANWISGWLLCVILAVVILPELVFHIANIIAVAREKRPK
jgi:hypothetical protein